MEMYKPSVDSGQKTVDNETIYEVRCTFDKCTWGIFFIDEGNFHLEPKYQSHYDAHFKYGFIKHWRDKHGKDFAPKKVSS